MAAPVRRASKTRTNARRSHHGIKKQFNNKCSNCNELKYGHRVCANCGFYKGKQVKDVK